MKDWIKELCLEIADWQAQLIADHYQSEVDRLAGYVTALVEAKIKEKNT